MTNADSIVSDQKCWVLTKGEYSDYSVLAVFSDEATALAQQGLWEADRVEELPFNVIAPQPPKGMSSYIVLRPTTAMLPRLAPLTVAEMREQGDKVYVNIKGELYTYMYARDEAHAIKIASERFTKYDAIAALYRLSRIPNDPYPHPQH